MGKLIVDGQEYPLPDFGDLTMGQLRTIKRYTGLSAEAIRTADTTDPDLIAAFVHLAIQVGNPSATFSQIEERVDAIKLASLDFRSDKEVDVIPPATSGGSSETDSAPPASGPPSDGSSDETPETTPPLIGVPV